ncbi:MAG TPA: translocation/assembly module TamB domain-containing protein, partial [Bacteroidia bacterium]|nr:translocation/assembly module TamB domain-containing protein [Bacteroidia bacterium]
VSVDKPVLSAGEGIGVAFKNFNLEVLSEIIERDSSLVDGLMNGKFDLVMEKEGRGIVADINLDKFTYKGIAVGDFVLKAKSEGKSKYLVDLKLSGNNNDVTIEGFYTADSTGGKIRTSIDIKKLNVHSIEPFTNGQISRSKGSISGKLVVEGALPIPEVTGNIAFADAGFNVAYLNNYFILKDENLKIKNKVLFLDAFTITDTLNHTAILNGGVKIADINNPEFLVDLKTDKFLAMNTKANDNNLFFGTLIISSDIKIRGNGVLPVITSNVKLLEGSAFTFVVPEAVATSERGEEDVKFTDPYNRVNSIMKKESEVDTFKAKITGFDLSANVEITKETTLRILVDRESGDSLVIKGDATMSFSIDPSGKTSLTGGFEISEGSYRVSLQNLVKKNFAITKGSSINWRGDIMDAEINIDAINVVNAVPLELVADQVAGLSEQEINAYRQRLPFQVILHMKGELIKPDISFEIS